MELDENYMDNVYGKINTEKINHSPEHDDLSTIARTHVWVDDTTVNECYNCGRDFSLFFRRHHCRLCGRIFCHICSNYRDPIPGNLVSSDNAIVTWNDYLTSYISTIDLTKHRVCIMCHALIKKINSVEKIVKVFNILNLDIKQLKKVSSVSKTWMNASNYCLLKIREIQYKLPTIQLNEWDKNVLWTNAQYFSGHSAHVLQLLKCCQTDNQVETVKRIFVEHKKTDCTELMCGKKCKTKITSIDAINLLAYCFRFKVKVDGLKKLAVTYLTCADKEFKCYIPFLVYNIKDDTNGIISEFLIERCFKNFILLNSLYWELQLYPKTPKLKNVYAHFLERLKTIISEKDQQKKFLKLLQGNAFVRVIEDISKEIFEEKKKYSEIKDQFVLDKEIILPLTPNIKVKKIALDKIKIKDSASKPLIIPCYTSEDKIYKIMYKSEDLRKDQVIMNIITLIDIIVKEELGIDLEMVTYNILPTSDDSGLIDIVNDCDTIYYIQEKLRSTILNYILENNGNIKIKTIRQRFIRTTAAFCVITYLLGIGDRHLDNIMVTKDGRLFHIDFGFILGDDPVFTNPGIRITPDIIEAIGGFSSAYYQEFKDMCSDIFNCLRNNVDIFMNMLLLLPQISDINKTEQDIIDQVIKRFIPGENEIDAKMHLVNQLEKNSYTDMIKDWCHYHSREQTISGALERLTISLSGLWRR